MELKGETGKHKQRKVEQKLTKYEHEQNIEHYTLNIIILNTV